MIRSKAELIFIGFFYLFTFGETIGISSKLGFGDSSDFGAAKVVGTQHKVSGSSDYFRSKTEDNIKTTDDFDNVGVVCTSNNCDVKTEKSTSNRAGVQADITVKVETKLNILNENKTEVDSKLENVDNISDVPIILGTKGTKYDQRTLNQGNLNVVNNLHTAGRALTQGSSGSDVKAHTTIHVNKEHPLHGTYNKMGGTYLIKSPQMGKLSPPFANVKPQSKLGSTFSSYPTVTVVVNQEENYFNNEPKYKSNGIEPYYDDSFINNFYRANTAQLTPYTGSAVYNPVQYKPVPQTYFNLPQPQTMNILRYHFHQEPTLSGNGGTTKVCMCQNQETNRPLQWFPNKRLHSGNPGTQINDKLGRLNK